MVYGLAFSSLCAVLFFAVPGFLMSCYSVDPQVLSEGVRVLRIIFLYQPCQAVALIYASGMRSCQRAGIPSIITTVGIVLVRPSLVYLLAGPLGVCAACCSLPCAARCGGNSPMPQPLPQLSYNQKSSDFCQGFFSFSV